MFIYYFLDIDDCPGNVCVTENTANCVDGLNQYTCDCILGYDGIFCENGESLFYMGLLLLIKCVINYPIIISLFMHSRSNSTYM